MTSNLISLPPHTLALMIPIVGMIVGSLIAVTAIVSAQWRRAKEAEWEASLKSQMLSRGMSASEIEQVIRAKAYQEEG